MSKLVDLHFKRAKVERHGSREKLVAEKVEVELSGEGERKHVLCTCSSVKRHSGIFFCRRYCNESDLSDGRKFVLFFCFPLVLFMVVGKQ